MFARLHPTAPLGALLLTALVALMASTALHGRQILHLATELSQTPFQAGHVWAFDHIATELGAGRWPAAPTEAIGYPARTRTQFLAWVPSILAAPLGWAAGSLVAFNSVALLSPAVSAVAAAWFLRRAGRAPPLAAAALGLIVAFCPVMLGFIASGQIAKVQLWGLLGWLGLLPWRQDESVGWGRHLLVMVWAMAASLTGPSQALYIPLLVPVLLCIAAFSGPEPWRQAWRIPRVRGLFTLGVATALGLLPARSFFASVPLNQSGEISDVLAHMPALANVDGRAELPVPSPVAQLDELLFGHLEALPQSGEAVHFSYVGIALLAAAIWVGRKRSGPVVEAWVLALFGAVLALGPQLALGGELVELDGWRVGLPASVLRAVGYPIDASGMYYRASLVAVLGLCMVVARGLASSGQRRAVAFTWILLAVATVDNLRLAREVFPLRSQPIPGRALLARIAADPTPGAVLALPLDRSVAESERALIESVFHERRTTALGHAVDPYASPHLRLVRTAVEDLRRTSDPDRAHRSLASLGFAWVIYQTDSGGELPRGPEDLRALGEPEFDGDLLAWRIDQSGAPGPVRAQPGLEEGGPRPRPSPGSAPPPGPQRPPLRAP